MFPGSYVRSGHSFTPPATVKPDSRATRFGYSVSTSNWRDEPSTSGLVGAMTEIPEPWYTALVEAGFVDQHAGREELRPSRRALATALGLGTTTVSRMISGQTIPKPATRRAVANALHVSVDKIDSWLGVESRRTPFKIPPDVDADLLDVREQNAVIEMIRLFVRSKGPEKTA